ncbi:MAG: sigma 54-interacting transcriptional regulator, partial [Bradymonadaceae bacterium]
MRLQLDDGEFRRVLCDELASTRRADLHRALAESALEAQLQNVGDRFLARHFLEGGDLERGFEFGLRAARRLHGEHSLSEARELFETLLAHASEPAEQREIRSYLLDIHDALGNFDRAVDQVRALSESADERSELDRLDCKEAELYVRTGDYERAEETFAPIYEGDEASEEEQIRAAALFGHAESKYLQGEHAEAESLVADAIETIEPGADAEPGTGDIETDRTLVKARNLQGKLALFQGELETAESLFSLNFALASERNFEREIARAELNLAVVDLQRGDYAAALESLEDLRSRSPGPEGAQRAVLLINLGMAAQHDADYEGALEHYRSALREAKRADYDEALGMAAYNLATALADLGAYERLVDILDRLEERQLAGRHLFAGELPETLRAKALIDLGEPTRALEELGQLDRDDQERVSAGAWADAVFSSVHAHLDLGQVEHARDLLEEFEIPEETSARDCPEGFKQSGWAAVYLEEGDYEQAASAAKEASELLRDAGFFTERARTTVTRVRALMELGREGEASALVDRRVNEFQERAKSVPEEFEETFYQIPAYAELVELGREVSGDTPAPYREYVEVDEEDEPETPDRKTDAFRRWRGQYAEIVGEDERLLKVFRRIDQVADSDSPVLIQGESGTGKELIAEAIHSQGTSQAEDDDSFVKVNCGAFVDNLLLSELFGHEKGAFTGAVEQKVGRFERADGGTIFLDEI